MLCDDPIACRNGTGRTRNCVKVSARNTGGVDMALVCVSLCQATEDEVDRKVDISQSLRCGVSFGIR